MPSRVAILCIVLALLGIPFVAVAQVRPAGNGGAGSGGASADPATGSVIPALVPGSLLRARRENPVVSVQEFVRLQGQMTNTLRGIGIVTGLKGTGDDGKELVLARPLAEVYKHNGNELRDLSELGKAKAAAIVTLSVTVPEGGGREGDQLDVFVQVSHSATSLNGGTLIVSPLMGPTPGSPVFAMAAGQLTLEATDVPTTARIRNGATLIRDIRPPRVGTSFDLILRPHFRSYQLARTLASEINDLGANIDVDEVAQRSIATVVDESTIRIVVPEAERSNLPGFLANVMGKRFSPSLVDLPAMVVVNERTGSIVVTGDVEIASVTVGSDALVITTTNPAPIPTPGDPLVSKQSWAEFGTTSTTGDRARIQDLLEAFKQLNVPARQQVQILAQIHQAGRLYARFVRE